MEQALTSVMKNIGDALRLDDDSHDKEAYIKYLDCILCIASNLLQAVRDKGGDVVVSKEITKQVKLAQQCAERVAVLIDRIGSAQKLTAMVLPMQDQRTPTNSRLTISVPPLPPEPSVNTFARPKGKSPMEIAYQQNQLLMAAYRARMARMNKRDPGAANLSLTIQRKMAENLALAKKQEMALAKKMQERQERLEVQAAKRFSTPIGMSKEEQEQRQIYKKILEYEQDAKWLQKWRIKLEANSQEPEVICQLIQEILRCRDHPLTLLLKQYQYKVYEKIYPLICNKKQLLAAITVPLPESLWPAELCKGSGAERQDSSVASEGGSIGYFSSISEDTSADAAESIRLDAAVDSMSCNDEEHTAELPSERKEDTMAGEEENGTEEAEVWGPDQNTLDSTEGNASNNEGNDAAGVIEGSENNAQSNVKTADEEGEQTVETEGNATSNSQLAPDDVASNENQNKSSNSTGSCHGYQSQGVSETKENSDSSEQVGCSIKGNGDATNLVSEDAMDPNENQNADSSSNITESGHASPATFTQQTKDEVSEALTQGQKLVDEQKSVTRVLRQVSQDYEQYNAENMDDLFDDDDDDDNNSDDAREDSEQDHVQNDLPESDQTSLISPIGEGDPSSLVSQSSSSGSVQDFPSLPTVNENRAEIERMSREAYQRHLKNISTDVHQYMEKMLIMFTIAYEQLDSPLGRDQCYASLEETFFKPLWKFLLKLFRFANYKDELTVACKMTQKASATPMEMGVTRRLWLISTGNGNREQVTQPYQEAIEELVHIKDHYTMLSKLECIVKVIKLILDGIKDFYISQGCDTADVPTVGADDLLPVVSYVALKTNLPQLVSECHAMTEFIHEGYIMGQEGYCLTTLETAVSYIVASNLTSPCSPP